MGGGWAVFCGMALVFGEVLVFALGARDSRGRGIHWGGEYASEWFWESWAHLRPGEGRVKGTGQRDLTLFPVRNLHTVKACSNNPISTVTAI